MFVRALLIVALGVVAWASLARTSSGAGRPERYVVRPADTLWSIAQAHYAGDPREGIWKLEQANHLRDATIVPGETLLVP